MDEPFVINLSAAPAFSHSRHATHIELEPQGVRWPDLGLNVAVMAPGQSNCRYHSEPVQEDFLVLVGECDVVLGEKLQRLRLWDFFHCPAGTEHVFVGAGDGPCAVLMVGSRREDAASYPYNELAARFDASAGADTDDAEQAYADWRQEPLQSARNPWPLQP